jgi:uncharacterized protein YndB with AHSA1/START domain
MKVFQAKIHIAAPAVHVWAALVDAESYPSWDPGMIRIEGQIGLGHQVKFFTKFSPDKAFGVKITAFEAPERMAFTGGMPLGLFKSERTHTLTETGTGTDFKTEEIFSGLLLPVFAGNLPDLTESFEQFVAGLKAHCEA